MKNNYLGVKYLSPRKRTLVVISFLLYILERPVVLRTGTYFEVSRWMDLKNFFSLLPELHAHLLMQLFSGSGISLKRKTS